MMSVSASYLEQLYEREQELFSEPLKKSALTESDLLVLFQKRFPEKNMHMFQQKKMKIWI